MSRMFSLAVCLPLLSLAVTAAPLKITAYINVTSGCQKHTEDLLANLAKTYGDKVQVEVVNFGSPAGLDRFKRDGMHCMGIRIDGQDQSEIVFRGVTLKVAFMKPAGFFWLHEELETAVRQKLEGVAESDRHSPQATTTADGETTTLVIGDEATFSGPDAKPIQAAAEALNRLAKEKPLIQEDFRLEPKPGSVTLQVRGQPLFTVAVPANPELPANQDAVEKAVSPLIRIITVYPRVSRPFPGAAFGNGHPGEN